MDPKQIGGMLQGMYRPDDSSMSDMLSKLEGQGSVSASSSELFPPLAMFNFPTLYRNRQGIRVDILGAVDEATAEYAKGFRFFDYFGYFYKLDGTTGAGDNHPDDLISAIDPKSPESRKKATERWKWVHPKYYDMDMFFQPLNGDAMGQITRGMFLNRMGFVVSIGKIESSTTDAHVSVMVDDDGKSYSFSGHRDPDTETMFDLVYHIINVESFVKSNWSSERVTAIHSDGDEGSPEMFDPGHNDRKHLTEEFFKAVLRAHSLSKQLGITYSFNMDTTNSF